MTTSYVNPRYTILLKEMDLIHSTIKNLDDIIYKTKNFGILIWGGSLFLIAEHVKVQGEIWGLAKESLLIYCTVLIPVIFWAIHYRWQKHLTACGMRERMISWFINSEGFLLWMEGEDSVQFPVYDSIGRFYTKQADKTHWERIGVKVDSAYFLDDRELRFWDILLYKDAKWYYLLMISISILFGALAH